MHKAFDKQSYFHQESLLEGLSLVKCVQSNPNRALLKLTISLYLAARASHRDKEPQKSELKVHDKNREYEEKSEYFDMKTAKPFERKLRSQCN